MTLCSRISTAQILSHEFGEVTRPSEAHCSGGAIKLVQQALVHGDVQPHVAPRHFHRNQHVRNDFAGDFPDPVGYQVRGGGCRNGIAVFHHALDVQRQNLGGIGRRLLRAFARSDAAGKIGKDDDTVTVAVTLKVSPGNIARAYQRFLSLSPP
jgi:hypothetical protein